MNTLAFLQNLNGGELIVILLVILLLFGGRKLPELARALGKSMNEFRKGRDEGAKPENDEEKPDADRPGQSPKKD